MKDKKRAVVLVKRLSLWPMTERDDSYFSNVYQLLTQGGAEFLIQGPPPNKKTVSGLEWWKHQIYPGTMLILQKCGYGGLWEIVKDEDS
jgi:hypothetical protein